MKINKLMLITGILILLVGIAFVNSKYSEAENYLGESYRQIQETIEQIDLIIKLQPSETVFWIYEGEKVEIIEQVEETRFNEITQEDEIVLFNITLANVDKRLTEIVSNEKWIEIRSSLSDLQDKISSSQITIDEYNYIQEQLAQMAGYIDENNEEQEIKFGNMWIEALQWNEADIINAYANANGLNPSDVTISDVAEAGYLMAGIPISGVSNEFRNLANGIRDKDINEISPAFLEMRRDVNEIAKKVNIIYGEETISVCGDVCTEGVRESITGGERECYDSNQDSCLEWAVTCFQGYTHEQQTDKTIICAAE